MSDANSPEHGATTGTGGTPDGTPSPTTAVEPTAAARRSEPGSVHVLLEPDTTRVVLAGDVDATLAPDLIDASTDVAEARLPVRIDTRNVTFMDSTGVSFLARVAVGSGGRPVLVDPPDHVQFLLDITAIGDLVDVERSDGADPQRTPTDDADGDDAA